MAARHSRPVPFPHQILSIPMKQSSSTFDDTHTHAHIRGIQAQHVSRNQTVFLRAARQVSLKMLSWPARACWESFAESELCCGGACLYIGKYPTARNVNFCAARRESNGNFKSGSIRTCKFCEGSRDLRSHLRGDVDSVCFSW